MGQAVFKELNIDHDSCEKRARCKCSKIWYTYKAPEVVKETLKVSWGKQSKTV